MKSRMHWNWTIGLALAVLPLIGGHSQESLSQPTNTAPAIKPEAAPKAVAPAPATPDPALAALTAENDVVDAPAKPMSTAKPLPSSVRPTAPVAEVIKLADSGVDEGVMLAFVTNSTSTFNLGAEEIIYLNDIGVPSAVVTAMIQRDQALKELSANTAPGPAAPAPAAPAPYPPETVPVPAPEEMAPQPDYTTENYPPPADNSYASFYDTLAPYGTWVDVAGYGPCWQPTVVIVNPGWQPYCNGGQWLYTDCGWYWRSGYSWGWAPFHYGRWFRHSHYGWCWEPGDVWGPSWVCWRYNGNYCGWAPLPPAAGFRAGIGLTYHGQHVSGGFAFGLGARSYTFVPASHFSDRHLNHYALPHQEVAHIYHQTTPSTTIVGNSTRVVNRGIPVSRVEAATHAQVRTFNIRDANIPGARSTRGERLEADSKTLSVFRPRFPQSTGAQPAYGGRARSDIGPGSGSALVTPAPAVQRVAPVSAPRTAGGSPAAQPTRGGGSGGRPDRSANQANASPMAVTGSAPTLARRTTDPAPGLGEPLILHGADRSRESTAGSGASAVSKAAPPSSLIVIGKKEGGRSQTAGSTTAPATRTPSSWPTATRQDSFARPAGTQRTQPFMTAEAGVQAPTQPSWSAPRTIAPPARNERPSQYTAPAYRAPAETPRSAPAPSYTPPRMQSYSPPTPSPAPRAEPMVSQPVHSAPSAPAPSAPATHSQSSSGRNGR
jgi:hypothetical protein